MPPLDPADAAEANRLYWETDDSVAEIAERLQISRRTLYDSVEPLPTGDACPTCGGPLTFENRSARTAGETTCAVCEEMGAADADVPAAAVSVPADAEDRALLVGGAAVAGAAMGALLTFAFVRRR